MGHPLIHLPLHSVSSEQGTGFGLGFIGFRVPLLGLVYGLVSGVKSSGFVGFIGFNRIQSFLLPPFPPLEPLWARDFPPRALSAGREPSITGCSSARRALARQTGASALIGALSFSFYLLGGYSLHP